MQKWNKKFVPIAVDQGMFRVNIGSIMAGAPAAYSMGADVLAEYSDSLQPGPSVGDFIASLLPSPKTDAVIEATRNYEYVLNSQSNYLIAERREMFLEKLYGEAHKITDTFFGYKNSMAETKLYNKLVRKYLLEVYIKNKAYHQSADNLMNRLKDPPVGMFPTTIH